MKQRFRLYRHSASGRFYSHDSVTGKQESLGTTDRSEAVRLLHSKNEADRQPAINLQIARAYLAAGDQAIMTRTWEAVLSAQKPIHMQLRIRKDSADWCGDAIEVGGVGCFRIGQEDGEVCALC